MKKIFLFSALPFCMFNAMAQGTSPETATPIPATGWFVPDLSAAPAEAWFTVSNDTETPVLWGDAPSNDRQVYAYICDGGQEAFQMTEGSNSYILLPGKEYVVKITPKKEGSYCMNKVMALPESWAGQRKYYPVPIKNEYSPWGAGQKMAPGETKWFYVDAPYASQLTTNYNFMPVTDIEKIEMIHVECPGGTTTGNGLIGPYFKAGGNVIGITVSATATGDVVPFNFGCNAMLILNCGNKILRGQNLTLDEQNTYPDAYYTVDRFFNVPEDGTYTFINHGAKGTILNIGTVDVDPENKFNGTCNWDNVKSATVGNSDAVVVVDNLKAGTVVAVQSDAFGIIGEGMENQPYLQVLKGNHAGIEAVDNDDDTLEVAVSGNVLTVSSVLLASGSEVAVYDMQARKIASVTSAAGAETLTFSVNAPAGMYMVIVYGKGSSEATKIVIK